MKHFIRIDITIMREFKKYAPRQSAKYVLAFFKGQFVIEGKGVFEFSNGKVLVSVKMDEDSIKMCKEINDQASLMSKRVIVDSY